jgi:pimeloyl-ACP methyl ester carboxylesterase
LCGAEDAMTPLKFSEALGDGILGAQLEIVPEAGHMLMLEQPDAVAKSLEQFLNTF